jgi:glucosamine--fructose-6-phosphate aminotransferase (isomerizing)
MRSVAPAAEGLLPPERTRMFAEAAESPAAVDRQLRDNERIVASLAAELRDKPPRFIVTGARGSSDHAATFAKYVFETQLGIVTASAAPSVSSIYRARQSLEDVLYLAVSQSGRSPDLLEHAQAARAAGARIVALVNTVDSPLAALAHCVLPLRAGPEQSVAATKSFVCTLVAILHLAAHWREDTGLLESVRELPAGLAAAWNLDWRPALDLLAAARSLFVIGRGLGLSVAQEAALKFKETCGLHAEAFSAAEVKHGPMALVDPGFPVLCFAQEDETLAGLHALVAEFRNRGANVLVATPESLSPRLPVAPSRHPACTPILAILSFYRMVNALAIRRGRNPDVPPHLRKVTETV